MTDRKGQDTMLDVRGGIRRWRSKTGTGVMLAVLLVGWPGLVAAQNPALKLAADTAAAAPGGATTITFDQALQLALRQNTTVRQAENAAALGTATVQAQRLQFLPNLQLSTTGSQNVGRSFSESQGSIINQGTQSLTAGISSTVTLFDGFSNVASLRQANLASDASAQDLTRARQTAAFTVASNFLTLVTDQEQLKVQQENLTAQAALEAQIEKMVQAGSRAISDQYQQQAVVAAAR